MEPAQDDIGAYRREIDAIDGELVALLNRRAACALAIGKIKRRTRQPVHVPERERDVLQRVAAASAGPLGGAAVQAVFEAIMAQMRLLEERVGAGQ